jgi:ketosteroid isomerase-like protein
MTIIKTFAIGIGMLASVSCNHSQTEAIQYITTSEKQWAESVATNDTTVLQRILADDFIWVYPDGTHMNK